MAEIFIVLSWEMTKDGAGLQIVKAELDLSIELLFRESETYRLALELYAGRYRIISCKDAADTLREAIEGYRPERAVSEDDEADAQPDE